MLGLLCNDFPHEFEINQNNFCEKVIQAQIKLNEQVLWTQAYLVHSGSVRFGHKCQTLLGHVWIKYADVLMKYIRSCYLTRHLNSVNIV